MSSVEFIVDSNGERVEAPELVGPISRWLWFSPAVVNEFLSRRSTELSWYTEDTAGLKMPLGTTIHFGINQIDLINVYAKDIAQLSVLWQKVWAAWNVAPDGKVAPELLASQMECRPADDDSAPESLFEAAVNQLDEHFFRRFGVRLYRSHPAEAPIVRNIHRFTAVDESGFYCLMKELTRFCIERLNISQLKDLTLNCDKNLGSLKRLEKILNDVGADGRELLSPLVGIYELRHFDSHLPSSSSLDDALALVELNREMPPLKRGKEAIRSVVNCLLRIVDSIA